MLTHPPPASHELQPPAFSIGDGTWERPTIRSAFKPQQALVQQRLPLAAITQAPSLLGSLTSLNFAPSPASVPDRQPQFFSSQYTALLAQQSHFTPAIVSVPCSRCPCSRGASTRTAPRAGRVVVEWRSGRGSRRGRRVDPRLGLTLGSRPSILPIATRDIACRLWNASDLILHLSSHPAGCCFVCDSCSPTSAPLTTTDNPRVTHCARERPRPPTAARIESNHQPIVPASNMPLCGGTKSVQRKLVLLYVPIAERRGVGRISKPLDQADVRLTAAMAHAARHRY